MHEFSLAASMLDIVKNQLGEEKALVSATVTVGPLSGVSVESLKFCFTEVAEMKGFGRPVLIVNEAPARAHCNECDKDYEIKHMYEFCPNCQSLARTILSGEELTLDRVEIEDEENG